MPNEISNRVGLEEELRDIIYNSKGDGWKGLDKGAIADAEKVGNLISVLDGIMKAYVPVENGHDLRNSNNSSGAVGGCKSTAELPGTSSNDKNANRNSENRNTVMNPTTPGNAGRYVIGTTNAGAKGKPKG
jgi:mediator of RNA polymerase II transcription subunit 14